MVNFGLVSYLSIINGRANVQKIRFKQTLLSVDHSSFELISVGLLHRIETKLWTRPVWHTERWADFYTAGLWIFHLWPSVFQAFYWQIHFNFSI